jgi:hypothetical protein
MNKSLNARKEQINMPKTTDETANDNVDTGAEAIQSIVDDAKNNQDEKVEDETEEEVEDDKKADEEESTDEDESDDEESKDEEESDSEEEKDEDKDKSDDSAFERKFKNLAKDGSTLEEYTSGVEKAYTESTAEAMRLSQELKTERGIKDSLWNAVQQDPELLAKLNQIVSGAEGATSGEDTQRPKSVFQPIEEPPHIAASRVAWEKQNESEVQAILDANPEITSNPALQQEIVEYMEDLSRIQREKGKVVGAGEIMSQALKILGIEEKKKAKEDVINKAKDLAASSRPTKSRGPKAQSNGLTAEEAKFADMLGVDRQNVEKHKK